MNITPTPELAILVIAAAIVLWHMFVDDQRTLLHLAVLLLILVMLLVIT